MGFVSCFSEKASRNEEENWNSNTDWRKYLETVTKPYLKNSKLNYFVFYPDSCTFSISNILKFNVHDFIACTISVHIQHFSCIFWESMLGWVSIAIQVKMFVTLTPTELCLALAMFKKLRVSCHNLFILGKRKPITYLTQVKRLNLWLLFSILDHWSHM